MAACMGTLYRCGVLQKRSTRAVNVLFLADLLHLYIDLRRRLIMKVALCEADERWFFHFRWLSVCTPRYLQIPLSIVYYSTKFTT